MSNKKFNKQALLSEATKGFRVFRPSNRQYQASLFVFFVFFDVIKKQRKKTFEYFDVKKQKKRQNKGCRMN